jgi:hypothetical protein
MLNRGIYSYHSTHTLHASHSYILTDTTTFARTQATTQAGRRGTKPPARYGAAASQQAHVACAQISSDAALYRSRRDLSVTPRARTGSARSGPARRPPASTPGAPRWPRTTAPRSPWTPAAPCPARSTRRSARSGGGTGPPA